MKILVVGAGGREHALAWKLRQSPAADLIFVAPGNGGTALEPRVENVAIEANDHDALLAFARDRAIDFVIVGPEAPLVAGIADAFAAAGIRLLGPSAAAAQLEGSKIFAKEFMLRHGIPTAPFRAFDDEEAALAYVRQRNAPLAIKADGLAGGKGVMLTRTIAQAEAAVRALLGERRFGAASARILVEDLLVGEEVSFIALVDGQHVVPLASAQDHKARDEGDLGPNTGGMGAYSPAPLVTPELHARILREVMESTLAGLRAEGIMYRGFLYAGLMIGPDGTPWVLEFNCRLGDPETQPILLRLRSDLLALGLAALDGQLNRVRLTWDPRPALGVVIAAGGYPEKYRRGDPILGLDELERSADCTIFHAGTRCRRAPRAASFSVRLA